MAKAYVLSQVVTTADNNRAPAIMGAPVEWSCAIAPDAELDTNPSKQWVLAIVGGEQAAIDALATDTRNYPLPFGPLDLDKLWIGIGTSAQRNTWASRITQQTGVTVTRNDPRTLREIITAVGRAVDSNFNPQYMDVRE